jgi:hypothetical protein
MVETMATKAVVEMMRTSLKMTSTRFDQKAALRAST